MNKLEDKYNDTSHRSIDKKPIDADYSTLTEEIDTVHKAPKFKVGGNARITKYNNIFSKGYCKKCSREILVIGSVLKSNPWTYKT